MSKYVSEEVQVINKELKLQEMKDIMEKVHQRQEEKRKVIANKQIDLSKTISLDESSPIKTFNNKQEVSILNKNDDLETICFASDEMLESIQLEDSTVEIVGFIDEMEGPKIVGKAQHYQLLKFLVNNNSQHRVQVVVWNAEIDRVKCHIQPNRIVHIDGAKAKRIKIPEFNQGTLPYELIIRSNTIINNLGNFNLKKIIQAVQPQLVDFCDIPEHLNSCIFIRGYIKTNFNSFSNSFKMIGSGSITDKTYKLEIQIINYDDGVFLEKGQFVQIKGYVKVTNDIFYLEVENMSDIKEIGDEKLSFQQLLLGTQPIVKKTSYEDNLGLPPRKIIQK